MSKTAKNDITGDLIKTKTPSKQYEDNYDDIFRTEEPPKLDMGNPHIATVKPIKHTKDK